MPQQILEQEISTLSQSASVQIVPQCHGIQRVKQQNGNPHPLPSEQFPWRVLNAPEWRKLSSLRQCSEWGWRVFIFRTEKTCSVSHQTALWMELLLSWQSYFFNCIHCLCISWVALFSHFRTAFCQTTQITCIIDFFKKWKSLYLMLHQWQRWYLRRYSHDLIYCRLSKCSNFKDVLPPSSK